MKIQGARIARQPLSFTWNPADGYVFLPEYKGTAEACRALSNVYTLKRVPHTLRLDGPIGSVEAEENTPEEGVQETAHGSWALLGNPETVDWRQHPKYLALTKYEQANIEEYIKNGMDGHPDDFIWTYSSSTQQASITITPSADAQFFMNLAYKGQQNYTRTARVLRHNLTVSQGWQVALSNSSIDYVYTTAQVIAEGSEYDDPIPDLIAAEMALLPSPASTPTGYTFGWLKQSPVIQTVANYKVECSVEYVLELWPSIFYPPKP